jgi:hypothetical protein
MPAIFSAEGKSCFELTPRSLIGFQIEPILLFPPGVAGAAHYHPMAPALLAMTSMAWARLLCGMWKVGN